MTRRRRAFTLIELLVVLFIIVIVSVVALPAVLPAFSHRQVSEAARILEVSLAGARDSAVRTGQPSGIRLLPDPAYPLTHISTPTSPMVDQLNPYSILAYNRIMPIAAAPEYNEGAASVYPGTIYSIGVTSGLPVLVLEQAVTNQAGMPNAPTSWFWNIRVGDKIQLNGAGPWYTIVGPQVVPPGGAMTPSCNGSPVYVPNPEEFVNAAVPGCPSPYQRGGVATEFLLLANGLDDNKNGWIDEGCDGVDNNGDGYVDNIPEWETEAWRLATGSTNLVSIPYTIRRRPAPTASAREVALPSSMVIDATTAFLTRERSRLPVNPYTGAVDIVLNPDGTLLPVTQYSAPSSFGMDSAFYHFWLADRQDLADVQLGASGTAQPLAAAGYLLPIASPDGAPAANFPGPYLRGEHAITTLNTRTGAVVTNLDPPFLSGGAYSPLNPFLPTMQGSTGQ